MSDLTVHCSDNCISEHTEHVTGTAVFTHFKFSPWNSTDLDAVLGCSFRVEVVCATDVSGNLLTHLQN